MRLADRAVRAPWRFPTPNLPPELEAKEPAEVRGTGRDDVRLLITRPGGVSAQARFTDLPSVLSYGDIIVLNNSATIPAALTARRSAGTHATLHISTHLPGDLYVVEMPGSTVEACECLQLPDGAQVRLLTPYRDSTRLWIARLLLQSPLLPYLAQHGRPIRYRHLKRDWPLETFQNVYASTPGSAEMPSAGRPLTAHLLDWLRARGIAIAFITLHAGVSSPERGEPPYEEWYCVPSETADAVRRVRRHGGRVVAVGTTVVRALESSLDERGRIVASRGWTDLVIKPERGVSMVDAVLTGFHEPTSSHLAMLEAVAGQLAVHRSYAAALKAGYLWHEFGDSHLLYSASTRASQKAA